MLQNLINPIVVWNCISFVFGYHNYCFNATVFRTISKIISQFELNIQGHFTLVGVENVSSIIKRMEKDDH